MRYNKFIATMYLGLMLSMSIFAANFTEDAEFFPYSDSVEDINKTSLMTYTDDTLWTPNDNVTVAEAITVCARIHSTYFGKTINNAIDIGLKTLLPDLIENQVIDIKNSLMENGLKAGIETAVDSAINFGKIFTAQLVFSNKKRR